MRSKLGVVLLASSALVLASCVVEGRVYFLEIRNSTDEVVMIAEGEVDWSPVQPGETAKYPIPFKDGCRDRPVLRALVDDMEVARLGPRVCEGVWEIAPSDLVDD